MAKPDLERYRGNKARGGWKEPPNWLLDRYCAFINHWGGPSAGWVFFRIWRETCGYGWSERVLSVRYIANGVGLSRGAVDRALEWLREAGFIERKKLLTGKNDKFLYKCEYRLAREIIRHLYRRVDDPAEDIEPEPVLLDPEIWVSEQMREFVYFDIDRRLARET